jgi:outer membrane protein assembly complex protein YaeT
MVTAIALRWTLVSTRLGLRIRVPILFAVGCAALFGAMEQYEGKTISSIQFEPAQQPLGRDQLIGLLAVRTGTLLRVTDLREAIQRLYATGEYTDIAVDATATDEGVVLKFMTKPSYFVGHVQVTGVPQPPTEGQLLVATKLQLGTEYSERDVNQAIESLTDTLRRNGFYEALIRPQTSMRPATQEVDIDFIIDPGKRAKFDGVLVTGHPDRSVPSIVKATGWKGILGLFGWRQVTENRVQSGVENVRSWYPRHDHLLARVTLVKLDYHPSTNAVTPTLAIESGPAVSVQLQGAKISKGKLRSILPIYQERSVDKDLLVEGTRDLKEFFQSQGFFDARVEFETRDESAGNHLIDYMVNRGIRHKFVRLEIRGNRYFDVDTLRERMYVTPASLFRFRHGRFSTDYLEKDLNAIRDLYRSNGFRDIEVTSREIDDYGGKEGQIGVVVDIKEGPQWFVSQLDIEGVPAADRDYLASILHSTQGQPYSEFNVATDRDNILDFYYNNGYPTAKFDFVATPDPAAQRVALRFNVTPGPREYVRNVVISGLNRTKPDVVNQRITLKSGDPLSQDKVTESQRRLYDLGIFARVDTAIQNPEGEEPSKYVLYSMDEARRYSLNIGLGAEIARIGGSTTSFEAPAGTTGFSPRVSLGIDRLNFRGLGHRISLQTRVSTLEQRALATYVVPQFGGDPNLNLQFATLLDISRDVRTFSARREEGSVQFGQKFSKSDSAQYRVTFREVNILGTPLVTPELIPLLSQPVRVGLVGASFIRDRRDDPVDSHRGVYNTIDVGLASKALGSQTGFGRALMRNASYYRVTKNLVLARSVIFGTIERYAGLSDIPLAERFFSGGSSSQRAFPDNQAGPRDLVTGFPIGGNALFVNTIELRFPLVGDDLGGVLFNDIGNVYSDFSSISLRFRQRNLQDFDYAVHSYGLGIRYKTPVGPIRVDLSLSPNSPRFLGFKGTQEQLLFGGGQQVVQRINVFQFHLSLGQAF